MAFRTRLCARACYLAHSLLELKCFKSEDCIATALRSKKPKSPGFTMQHFVDARRVRAVGGRGGDGAISFLQLWSNDAAGPDGGDGGCGGHVILQASHDVSDLKHVTSVLKAEDGEKGYNKDCNGKNAQHTIVKVPVGTVVCVASGTVVADLQQEGYMFVAARGGAGGHGNHFFTSDTLQTPKVAECGAEGEDLCYLLEISSMAHVGLIGLPNAGKSTLLRAISRARPKVAPYPFTTLKPHVGIVQYDDYEQLAVADLPGLIEGSHRNRGLGIAFLKHAERCAVMVYVVDMSCEEPWTHVELLQYELSQFSREMLSRPQLIVCNKMDLPQAQENFEDFRAHTSLPVVGISAKLGTNVVGLLQKIRVLCDGHLSRDGRKEQ